MAPEERQRAACGEPEVARELLWGASAREVLARIVPEDALGLRARIGARIAARALLVDADRVLLRAQALCALQAGSWRGEPELSRWLDLRVEEALAAVVSEAAALSEETAELEHERALPLEPFAAPLALDARALASACARFNRLPFEQREAFCAVVLDAVAADRLARARGQSLSELARRARVALELFRPAALPAGGARGSGQTGA